MLRLKDGVEIVSLEDERLAETDKGGGIVLDTNSGRYLEVNSIALEMITALVSSEDVDEAINSLMERISIDRQTLEGDLKEFVDNLIELGLVVLCSVYSQFP